MTRPPSPLKALLWDVDGTLAETERDGHRVAFNPASEAFKLPWRWSVAQYGPLLAITGGCAAGCAGGCAGDRAGAGPARRVAPAVVGCGRWLGISNKPD